MRWFTNADQLGPNWQFALRNRAVATGFYPCCGALGATGNGSLELLTTPAEATNFTQPFRSLGYSVHPVIGLNDNATLGTTSVV